MKKVLKEWFFQAPWGKLAFISWGNPNGDPVLLVHGRQDSAATFIPLLDLLPDDYHYVGVDMPGHGKSDPFPIGVMLSRFNFVVAVDLAVKHLGWKKFIYMCHSMGGESGLYYNAIYPNQISKFIHLDIGPALQNIMYIPLPELYEAYENYYDNYNAMNFDDREYSKRKALDSVMRARGLTEEQAELVLCRNLKRIGDDRYKLSWDKRLKKLAKVNLPYEFHLKLFTTNIPPTLFIASAPSVQSYGSYDAGKLVEEMRKKPNFVYLVVEGTHDVHLTNPERLAGEINAFLKKDFVTSKL